MRTLKWEEIITLNADREHEPLFPGFEPLTGLPLVILVGLTGVGKTTALTYLDQQGVPFTLLPNRRKIADEVIIASLQQEAGQTPFPVKDRIVRFEYTARYRARHPGGVAHALSRLAVNTLIVTGTLIFDGLRGLEEVQQASFLFKKGRFVVLDAPDTVRLTRLLQRGDAFDRASIEASKPAGDLVSALMKISGITDIFTPGQVEQIARFARTSNFSLEDIAEKVSIVVKERKNYDSNMARVYLSHTLPPRRVLVIDTAQHWASTVARQIAEWLKST